MKSGSEDLLLFSAGADSLSFCAVLKLLVLFGSRLQMFLCSFPWFQQDLRGLRFCFLKTTLQCLNSCETWGTASPAVAVTRYSFGVCPLTCFLRSLSQIAVQNCKYPWDPIKWKLAFCAVEFSMMLNLDFSAVFSLLVTNSLPYAMLQCRSTPELFVERLLSVQKATNKICLQ